MENTNITELESGVPNQSGHVEMRDMLITDLMVKEVENIAEQSNAAAVIILCDAFLRLKKDPPLLDSSRRIIYVMRSTYLNRLGRDLETLQIPDVPLTRMSQVKLAIFIALSRQLIAIGDRIVCLTGPADGRVLDTLFVSHVGYDTELFSYLPTVGDPIPQSIRPEVMARVIDLAVELGAEGREGKPVGALFVIGDTTHIMKLSRALILNPFYGYRDDQRNILDPMFEETIKEFSSIDGAFIIREDGVVESCGVFLKAPESGEELPHGLGSRHHIAAGITAVTESLAISLSESTGTVTIFSKGKQLMQIEKQRILSQGIRFS